MQYKARLQANKGHNYQYFTNELYYELQSKGYKSAIFDGEDNTRDENIAIRVRNDYRDAGNYARIVCITNKIRIRTYIVYYKPKKGKS